jgi:hypothetical protein
MTKDQYDHIRHILITTSKTTNGYLPILPAIKYVWDLAKSRTYYPKTNHYLTNRVIGLKEARDIVLKIQSKL